VLAFVVLLTGLVVAYFSRAMSDRQISTSSASQTRVQAFALGATNSVIDDLRQEIAAGSTAPNPMPSPITTNLYIPTAVAMVPSRVVKGTSTPPVLVKQSVYQKPFFPSTDATNYPSESTFPPSNRAIGPSAQSATSVASLNGRSISAARWNKPLFLKAKATTDYTPADTNIGVPDWVLVARNGSNPTAWNALTLASRGNKYTGTASTDGSVVIGRYAYNIYDEGGLLDVNVAGYPSPSPTPTPGASFGYKSSEAFADLTQTGLTAGQVNSLVGWRNGASMQTGGTFPNYTFSGTTATNYLAYVIGLQTGNLTTANQKLTGTNQSDHLFTGRQQFISFLSNLSATSATMDSLQYLTTFSRDLNQPSYARTQSISSGLPGYNGSAPQVQTIANGGNNQAGLDTYVNPAFLTVRVRKTFTRNDGTQAVLGEPLVKKRFALMRLAWLTYMGPSGGDPAGSPPTSPRAQTDPDIQTLINTYNIPYSFLKEGTADNIRKYFGLDWVADSGSKLGKWVYDVHNGTTGSGTSGAVMRLGAPGDTAGLAYLGTPREPDFFELLKASIGAGSKAKALTKFGGTTSMADFYAQRDISFDCAIMQIGANIIAQSRVDGYGVRISFNDGTTTREFYGVDNNPYMYRARWGVLKIRNENPVITGSLPVVNAAAGTVAAGSGYGASQGLLKDPGVVMVMLMPEIWNPHDQNNPMPTVRPTAYRMVADSTDPNSISTTSYSSYNQFTATGEDTRGPGNPLSYTKAEPSGGSVPPFSRNSGGTGTEITGSYKGYLHPLIPSNTALAFDIPNSTLFREPTLLGRYGIPSGSNLHIDSSKWSATAAPDVDYQKIQTTSGVAFTSNQGFTADVTNPLVLPASVGVTSSTQYVGIPIGLFPSEWVGPRVANQSPSTARNIYRSDIAAQVGSNLTLRMQFQDPSNSANWITYDAKYVQPNSAWFHSVLGANGAGGLMQAIDIWSSFTDPRSSQFGQITSAGGSSNSNGYNAPGAAVRPSTLPDPNVAYGVSDKTLANASEWIDAKNSVLISNRPTADAGFYVTTVANQNVGWNNPKMVMGLLEQNAISSTYNGLKYSGSFGTDPYAATAGGAMYYADADNVVRRAMGGYNTTFAGTSGMTGLPMASTLNPGPATVASQSQSRPWILHRPFQSVAELGYVFSGTPWKNLDFFTPESGDTGLLDVFCINDTDNVDGLVAGKVNLNTQQQVVLRALMGGAYIDDQDPTTILPSATGGLADQVAAALVTRTASTATGAGKLTNLAEIVGKWIPGASSSAPINGSTGYDGLSKDLTSILSSNQTYANIQRFREAAVRPLSAAGTARTWNLMIDLVAQTGRYPATAADASKFIVEGEQRYWVHVAIDRFTGQVIDKKIETVKE